MKRKIFWGVIVLMAVFLVIHGFLGKNARQRQEGTVFYLKKTEISNVLCKANANTKNEIELYTHEEKADCRNQNILGYYYEPAENQVFFVALQKDETDSAAFALYSLVPDGVSVPVFVRYYPEYDGKGPFTDYKVKIMQDGKTLYNEKGSLFLRGENGERTQLRKMAGTYHEEISPGYLPIGFTPDGNYALYSAKVHGSKWMRDINAFFTQLLFSKTLGEDVFIIDVRNNTNSRYIKDAYDFQFVPDTAK